MHINHIDLFTETIGQGSPIITIHGGLGLDHTHYRPWLDPLSDAYKLVYYDQRSNGRSEIVPEKDLNFTTLVEDVYQLQKAIVPTGKAIILGHSYGGFIALKYALKHPELISHLILVNTCAYFDEKKAMENMLKTHIPKNVIAEFNSNWGTDAKLKEHFAKIGKINFVALNQKLSDEVFAHTIYRAQARERGFALLEHYDLRKALSTIDIPTLVACGEQDVILPLELSQELADHIPHATLKVFSESAHFPYVEQNQLFLDTIRQWLTCK